MSISLKNKINTPSAMKCAFILTVLLSILFFTPYVKASEVESSSITSSSFSFFDDLCYESIEIIAGKEESVLLNLELNGMRNETHFDLSSPALLRVSQINFVVADQTNFSKIWTNPLWQFPNGLSVKIIIQTTNLQIIQNIYQHVQQVFYDHYGVMLEIYNIQRIGTYSVQLSLMTAFSYSKALVAFVDVIAPDNDSSNGNFEDIFFERIKANPIIYAFGYTLKKSNDGQFFAVRKAMLGLEKGIIKNDQLRSMNVSYVLGEKLISNPRSLSSKMSFKLPFPANITHLSPSPDNFAPEITGVFEWSLRFLLISRFQAFDALVEYYPATFLDMEYPRVVATSSYSDDELNQNGILDMVYSVQNVGTSPAINTTIIFPIPEGFEEILLHGANAPVLKEDIRINETVSSLIEIRVSHESFVIIIKVLDIQGWYENITEGMLVRWMDDTTIVLNEYLEILSSNGIPLDIYNVIIQNLDEYMQDFDIWDFYLNPTDEIQEVYEILLPAINNAYNALYEALYDEIMLFQFNQNDFTYVSTIFGSYLYCNIPVLDVNESVEISWNLANVPTTNDRFGIFRFEVQSYDEDFNYILFQSYEYDYKNLMIAMFVQNNISGRFLSDYSAASDTFVSLGSRFKYQDVLGREYYGLTNGLNLQIGDEEAVLSSTLLSNESIYVVGDEVSFLLDIQNVGTLTAYDVRVDIVNMKLNYLWLPTEIVPIKSFSISHIDGNASFVKEFSIKANSNIGLNTYVALISFISDKLEDSLEIPNPWSNEPFIWAFSGETLNVVSSTMVTGILVPPLLLQNQARPSFPVPELSLDFDYQITEDNQVTVIYEITNTGLSSSNLTISQVLDNSLADSLSAISHYITEENEILLTITSSATLSCTKVNLANVTLNPGEMVRIQEVFSNIEEEIVIPPIIIVYSSLYEIQGTTFQAADTNFESTNVGSEVYPIKMEVPEVIEEEQFSFEWSVFSPVIKIKIPLISTDVEVTFSSLPYLYPLISAAALTVIVLVIALFSRKSAY